MLPRKWEMWWFEEQTHFCCCDRSSIWVTRYVLGCVGEGSGFDTTDFAFFAFLFFNDVGVHIGLFCCWGVFDIIGKFDSSVVIALVAVLSDLSVGFSIEIFGLDCGNIPNVSRYMRLTNMTVLLSISVLSGGLVAHVSDDCVFLWLCIEHEVIKYLGIKIIE